MKKDIMEKGNMHRTPNYAGWAGLDGIDLKKDIEQLEHIEHDIEHIKEALYDTCRVLNYGYNEVAHKEYDEKKRKEKLQSNLNKLHDEIMNKIISFCRENNVDKVWACHLGVDGLCFSVDAGEWHPGTDSALVLYDEDKNVICESL